MGSLIKLHNPPLITAAASVAGRREEEGPLGGRFDISDNTDRFGKSSWETSEGEMLRLSLVEALKKAALSESDLGVIFSGDLLNQCVSSSYGLLSFNVPHIGLYGACSTAAEGLMLAALLVEKGVFRHAAALTSSHNCSAERQFRYPLEYGGQRAPTAQWTVTGAGAFIVSDACLGVIDVGDNKYKINHCGTGARITEVLPGRSFDSGISDINNMGAAMAPAAADTLLRYFEESGKTPEDFDLIATGDLAREGSAILRDLMHDRHIDLGAQYTDCGLCIYNIDEQDMHAGGSGCGCSAVVLATDILPRMAKGELREVLFIGTGALMSPTSVQQGEIIPGIAHLVHISLTQKASGEEIL